MYASACLLLLLLSLSCLVSHNPYSTQTRALCTTATAQYSYLTVIPLSYFLAQPRTMHKPQTLFPSLLLLLCGDISLNPGPVSASHSYPAAFVTPSAASAAPPPPPPSLHIPRQTRSSNKTFLLYSLNIRSLLNPQNYAALTDLASSSHPPDLIALQETKISNSSSSDAHMSYSLPPGYSLHSFPRTTPSKRNTAEISGGGSAFLVHEPAIVLYCSCLTFKSFECSSITLRLVSDILTVYNNYRPPDSSAYSTKQSVFIDEFGSLLSR